MEGKPRFHQLVSQAKSGDENAFIQIVYRLNQQLKNIAAGQVIMLNVIRI